MDHNGVAREGGEQGKRPPPKPGKLAKDGKQLTPQPAIRIDSKKKIQNFVIFFQIFIKIVLQTFKIFNKILKNCSNFHKFFSKQSHLPYLKYSILKLLKTFTDCD